MSFKIIFISIITSIIFNKDLFSQNLPIPAVAQGEQNNHFTAGTGDGASLLTYNSFLKLHYGLAIGSPFVNNGSGGFVEKATISFNGRDGSISTLGNIHSYSNIITDGDLISSGIVNGNILKATSKINIPSVSAGQFNNFFSVGTGDGSSLSTYNTILRLHNGLAIGSPFVSDGAGGFEEKATISFNGRNGNITTSGSTFVSGNIGVGTDSPDAKLTVKGDIHTQEVKVDLNGAVAPDFVFEETYALRTLEETENYIQLNKHLPEIPSASEMEENGFELKEMNLKLLQKVEELTLYLIIQNKQNKEQQERIEKLEKVNSQLLKKFEKK